MKKTIEVIRGVDGEKQLVLTIAIRDTEGQLDRLGHISLEGVRAIETVCESISKRRGMVMEIDTRLGKVKGENIDNVNCRLEFISGCEKKHLCVVLAFDEIDATVSMMKDDSIPLPNLETDLVHGLVFERD